MTPQLKINAREAAQRAAEEVRAMNASRYIPPQLDMIREISEKNKIYIFNVGPWQQERLLGSLGTAIIRACPEGKEYSEPYVIQGIVEELYPISGEEFKRIQEEGIRVAMDILGTGPHSDPRNSFIPYGVFISKTNPPSKEDVKEARKALNEKYRELVAEADAAMAQGPGVLQQTIQPHRHILAARALKKSEAECPWLRNATAPQERDECPSCGDIYKVGIMKCRSCGYILDKERYQKAQKEGMFAS